MKLDRKTYLKNVKRAVIKIGSGVLTRKNGLNLNIIDGGAEIALTKNGKSLLPSGITAVQGRFSMGDSVVIQGQNKQKIALGMVNYSSGDLQKIIGARTSEIESILGYRHDDEIVHRDNLILESRLDTR